MHIRKYIKTDEKDILEIYVDAKAQEFIAYPNIKLDFDLNKNKLELEKFLKSDIYVLENEGETVAFGGYRNHYISFLYVKKEEQYKGYGEKLLGFILDKIGGTARLHTYSGNEKAINFYLKNGFRVIGNIEHLIYNQKVELLELYRD